MRFDVSRPTSNVKLIGFTKMAKRKSSRKSAEMRELKKIEAEEENIELELKKFERDIEKLRTEIRPAAIEKFTTKDVARGIVGAIFGMSIMAWHEGVRNAAIEMSFANVIAIVLLTMVAGTSVLYFSQYRKIKEKWIVQQLLPKRFVFLYALAMGIVFSVYVLFNIIQIGTTPTEDIIKLILVVSLPAVIGASTADIIR